jgi:hypothetical protein
MMRYILWIIFGDKRRTVLFTLAGILDILLTEIYLGI